jgi:hypothetical protein
MKKVFFLMLIIISIVQHQNALKALELKHGADSYAMLSYLKSL